jgi:hypothetical protein
MTLARRLDPSILPTASRAPLAQEVRRLLAGHNRLVNPHLLERVAKELGLELEVLQFQRRKRRRFRK